MLHHVYFQKSGLFIIGDNTHAQMTGYAGCGHGLNNPDMENVPLTGPLHCGFYDVSGPSNDIKTGPFTLSLTAWKPLYGRGEFKIHGDNQALNRTASEGCIVLPLAFRQSIYMSRIPVLAVLRGS